MINIQVIEAELVSSLKNRDQLSADTLRALKTRLQNEKIKLGKELSEVEILQLVQSEIKRRKDAEVMYLDAGRQELADKERQEIAVLEKFLPKQATEEEITEAAVKIIAENSFTSKDLGKAIASLKTQFGMSADGATISKILKEKLSK